MAQENRSVGRRPAAGGDPASEVPEADAVEQRAPAGGDEGGDGWENPSEESFERAAEADVVEQAREAGVDDEDRR
ncbi:hypothetical protein HGB44_07065 [Nocardiopsis dassonvillei subsp. albirubida]|uniref:Uncharacterized protein n=1 Tax=Nocardiopsis alborubida TaxID=146802 RepID=A0A7X6RPQ5_9ACTN|nr:hypothetical protein [Nocardiopsis alborubida]NKY97432.1 hypothetical protein [Nocardiopsis alborubida]